MTFRQMEAATQLGDSFETYLFQGLNFTYEFTSHFEDVVISGKTYTAIPIRRSSFGKDLVNRVVRCHVQAPVSSAFLNYIVAFPVVPTKVEIRKYYFHDLTQSGLVFYGTVKSFSFQKQIADLECISSIDELNQKVPRVFIQSCCNNVFGGPVCSINLADYTETETVLEISEDGKTLTLTGIINFDGWYGGYQHGSITFDNDSRYISEHVGNQIQIHFPLRDLAVGDTVQVILGCDKRPYVCRMKFTDNRNNFVGMPYVPYGANPVSWGVD